MKALGSARDPLWFKDAIIYELHVRAFFDSNNDGIGDFRGLTQKLNYLQDLGVTCIWLLPFFPSPLRDDGYDIANYLDVHPDYGTLDDFREFLNAAHERNLQVLIELVINHTSDQHPWFQAARNAPPGAPERDYYVWSDSAEKYSGVRIIFTDTEKSNWTWDPVAKAYYWHRFFSHQPDLNFDNPKVLEEVNRAMRFWLDMGVDGLRLDAIPYLVERDGTNCENLPETHAMIKSIRAEMEHHYANRMILAEANQWPSDVRAYFGDGDECHMAFHFPLMPRIFMALRLEDRLPITDIIAQTPAIPESCQWGLFLRNHDELTLEMVTDEERDYMYFAYSADPRMRVNVGIRRRLAPLMDNNSRRIELLNSLLFSFPGTPILYYGDELGMGDNIYLGDRNGVRTPMQWSADRNGGFSRATPEKLYSPVIMDPVYGYASLNVEAQENDSSSMLTWMRNMTALRKLFRVFGRGTIEFLNPSNRKILAYLRRMEGEEILCVANLSRFAQPVALDLRELEGMQPVEMLGYVKFPVIGSQPYLLSLAAYGFLWFELHRSATPETQSEIQFAFHGEGGNWEDLLAGPSRDAFEKRALLDFLPKQRWFAGKARTIRSVSVIDWGEFAGGRSALAWLRVYYADESSETYLLPLSATFGAAANAIRADAPHAVIASLTAQNEEGILHDAVYDDASCAALLSCLETGCEIPTALGAIRGEPSSRFADIKGEEAALPPVRGSAEQSNSSILFGKRLIMKLFRRPDTGPNPDCEIGEYLQDHTTFQRIPPFAGSIEYLRENTEPATIAMLQGLVSNEGDGWAWHLHQLERYFEEHARSVIPQEQNSSQGVFELSQAEPSALAHATLGIFLESAAILGRRTGEMHSALATPTQNSAFAPEPLQKEDLVELAAEMEERAASVFSRLKQNMSTLPDEVVEQASLVLSRRSRLFALYRGLRDLQIHSTRTRIHGDYHLGQVLRVKNDYVILDFEGEPGRPLASRRAKHSPLKDIAGMLRSFSYAAQMGLLHHTARRPEAPERLEAWAKFWERSVQAEFLRAYRGAASSLFPAGDSAAMKPLLEAYLLDKAFYELLYEMENRPAWLRIPLGGILSLDI